MTHLTTCTNIPLEAMHCGRYVVSSLDEPNGIWISDESIFFKWGFVTHEYISELMSYVHWFGHTFLEFHPFPSVVCISMCVYTATNIAFFVIFPFLWKSLPSSEYGWRIPTTVPLKLILIFHLSHIVWWYPVVSMNTFLSAHVASVVLNNFS